MSVVIYPLAVTHPSEGGYAGDFPDLPGAGVHADDAAGLLSRARESLRVALRALEASGDAWPRPTPLDALAGRGMIVLVDVQVEDTPVRVNISIGERLLARLDATANAQGMTRSGFIASAVRRRLDEEPAFRRMVDEEAVERLRREVSHLGKRLNEAVGPDSDIGRALSDLDDAATDGLRKLTRNLSSALTRRRPPGPPPAAEEDAPSH